MVAIALIAIGGVGLILEKLTEALRAAADVRRAKPGDPPAED